MEAFQKLIAMTEMTAPAEPEQRYVITESQCRRIVGLNMHDNAQKLIKEIRQIPYPPKMASDHDPHCKECIGRFDECASSDDCECIAYCIMGANNIRRLNTPAQQRIADAIKEAEEEIGCCRMVFDNSDDDMGMVSAYNDLEKAAEKLIALLREEQ